MNEGKNDSDDCGQDKEGGDECQVELEMEVQGWGAVQGWDGGTWSDIDGGQWVAWGWRSDAVMDSRVKERNKWDS